MSDPARPDHGASPLPIPRSWYLALYSEELPRGAVRSLEYVGRSLVAFRSEAGHAAIVDAHCPHLGAHLGVGGRVEGDVLRCPFHGWAWAGDGRCREIPYAKTIPPGARLHSWPVVERNGALWFWYDPAGQAPDFEVPILAEWGTPEFGTAFHHHSWTVRTHPQDILENGIDWPHSQPVHGFDLPHDPIKGFDGPRYHWGASTGKAIETMAGQREAFRFRVETWGMGLSHVRYQGLFSVVFQIGHTPIDATRTQIRFSILSRESDRRDPEIGEALRRYEADNVRTFEQDFPIWENKCYRERPLLCDGDGPIPEFRRWAAQFYGADPGTATPHSP